MAPDRKTTSAYEQAERMEHRLRPLRLSFPMQYVELLSIRMSLALPIYLRVLIKSKS